MARGTPIGFLVLLAADIATGDDPVVVRCDNAAQLSSRAARCRHPLDLTKDTTTVVCVRNDALTMRQLLTGGLLRLFDVETGYIRGESLRRRVRYAVRSEDTWLTGLVSEQSAEAQARTAFQTDSEADAWFQFGRLTAQLGAALSGGESSRATLAVSPFQESCVALRAVSSAGVNVTVEWYHEGPLSSPSAAESQLVGRDDVGALTLWSGPLLFLSGLLLFVYADVFAESVVFHYASGVSLFMLLSIFLLAVVVWHRMGRRRPGLALGALLSAAGITFKSVTSWMRDAAIAALREYWPYALVYVCIFGLVGYAVTYWRLQGDRPPVHERVLLARAMRLAALAFIGGSTHSMRASATLLAGVVLLGGERSRALVTAPVRLGWRAVGRATERGPAPPPVAYRPPTASGRYLSADEYAAQGEMATDDGMKALLSSPEFRQWALTNHSRISLAPHEHTRQPDFDDDS